jgi:hypothetical protein
MPMNTMANGRNASQIRVIPHGIFNPVMASTKVETSYLGGIYPPLSKQVNIYQYINEFINIIFF